MKKLILILLSVLIATSAYALGGHRGGSQEYSAQTVLNQAWDVAGYALQVTVTPDASIITGQVTMDAGVEMLDVAKRISLDSAEIREIIITTLPTNTQDVYIGNADTANASLGYVLAGTITSDTVRIKIDNVYDIYFSSSYHENGISWMGIVR